MNYKLTITPAVEYPGLDRIEFKYSSAESMLAAKNTSADLLLFLHNIMVMPDYSNIFVTEELIDGEWVDFEEGDQDGR